MKRTSKIEMFLKSSEEFVEELGKEALFAETPPETMSEALAEIADILDTVADENGIDEETDLGDEDEDALLDAGEDASAYDEDEFDEIHQSFIAQGLEGVDGKNLTIIEVSGPHANVNVNPAAVEDTIDEPSIEPLGDDASIDIMEPEEGEDAEAPLMLDEDEPIELDEGVPGESAPGGEEEEDAFLGASFKAIKGGKALFSSIQKEGTTLANLSQALRKPVVAHRVTIRSGWKDRSPAHTRAWASALMRFSGKFQGYPETPQDFGYIQLQAARILSREIGMKTPVMDLSQAKSGAPFRALIFSKMRQEIALMRAIESAYGPVGSNKFDVEYDSLAEKAKHEKPTAEGFDSEITKRYKTMQKMQKGKKGDSWNETLGGRGDQTRNNRDDHTSGPKFKMASLLPKYLTNSLKKDEAVALFSTLLANGYIDQMPDQMKDDAGFMIEQGLMDATGKVLDKRFIKSEEGALFDNVDGKGSQPGGPNAARMGKLPDNPGLPFLPGLLASARKVVAKGRSLNSATHMEFSREDQDSIGRQETYAGGSTESQTAVTADDGFTPQTTRLNKNSENTKFHSDRVAGEGQAPGLRVNRPTSMLARDEETGLGDGAETYWARRDMELPQDTQISTFGKVDPNSVTGVDHLEIEPLKIEASIKYRLTPFTKINANFSVADKNYEIVLSRKDATTLGLPINEDRKLFSAKDLPELGLLLSKATLAQGFVKAKDRIVLRSDLDKALILKSSVFSTVLVKAGLVNGLKSSKYSTFRRIGDQYLSPEGYTFPVTSGLKYGRPEYLVICQSQKNFFANKTQVSASVTFDEILTRVDRGILSSARAEASSYAQETASLQRKLVAMNSAYAALKQQTQKDAQVVSRKIAQLETVNSGLKLDINSLRLSSRVDPDKKVPGVKIQSGPERPHVGSGFRTGARNALLGRTPDPETK